MRSGRCSSWRVSLFCSPRSVAPQSWLHLPPKTPLRYSLKLIVFFSRGQPPFRVLLACGRSCCYSLSHFLQLTFHVGLLPCSFSLFVHLILYTPSLTPQRQPHARAVIHSLISFHSATFTFRGLCLFQRYYPCGCSIVPFHST